MNILSAAMKPVQLVLLTFLVANVFGHYDDILQKGAISRGPGQIEPRAVNRGDYDVSDYSDDADEGDDEIGDDGIGDDDIGDDEIGDDDSDNDPGNEDRVVGGQQAAHGEFPWQVTVKENNFFSCGAVILNEFWILSAAHCFNNDDASDYSLTVGNHHLKRKDTGEHEYKVEKIINHEKYGTSGDIFDNDIALLKIKPSAKGQGIKFSKYVKPVRLPDANTHFREGTNCLLAGWGRTARDAPVSDILLKVNSPIVDQKKCKEFYADLDYPVHITERMICSGSFLGGKGACSGDSGGGLVCQIGNTHTLAGIVSGGIPCANPDYPDLYTLVPKFIPWIRSNMQRYSLNLAQSRLP